MNSNLLTWAHPALYDSFLASMALALLLGARSLTAALISVWCSILISVVSMLNPGSAAACRG